LAASDQGKCRKPLPPGGRDPLMLVTATEPEVGRVQNTAGTDMEPISLLSLHDTTRMLLAACWSPMCHPTLASDFLLSPPLPIYVPGYYH
jgi:hypothetical protein